MPKSEHETEAFMTAYNNLKGAAKALEQMAKNSEPDLDQMLVEVKKAKQAYDRCNEVIGTIKSQVENIFSSTEARSADLAESSELFGRTTPPSGSRKPPANLDDDIPF